MTNPHDKWTDGRAYEDFMGRWSRKIALRFVTWLHIPKRVHWLDVGCGTGALTAAVCRQNAPVSIVGCDASPTYIEYARHHSLDACATFVLAGAGALPRRSGGYGSVSSLFALNYFPDPQSAVREMESIVESNGLVSACVWDYGDGMQYLDTFWREASALDRRASEHAEGSIFPFCSREALSGLFRAGGLKEVRCDPLEIAMVFADFDDYWFPMVEGNGNAPYYLASLDAEHRRELAGNLKRTLPTASDGSIPLTARAWAVRGMAA